MRTILATASRAAFLVGALGASLTSCRGLRASTVPLGGTHAQEEPRATKSARAALPAAAPETASVTPQSDKDPKPASDVPATPTAAPDLSTANATPAAPGAFQVKPYVDHQAWTRLFDLEFAIKVGPGGSIDMKMVSHQEARFEVLSVSGGAIDKLAIDYSIYASKLTVMGQTQDSPEELAGKRFVVTFAQGKPDVRDASGGTPPKKQIDSVKDDAREPLEIEKSLKELSQLAVKGRGDFTTAGAVALAGGEDEDTKVTHATASLKNLNGTAHGEKLALLDLGYTMTNVVDDKVTIEVELTGSMTVIDAPARYQTSTLQGPMELRSSEPGGMQGRGTLKVVTSYKY